jgi:DNA polymerase-4
VAGCSREARRFGVHSAMPLRRAYELCPHAVFLHPNFTHYAEYSERVTDLLAELVPVLEKASIDEFYMDLAGCGRVFGNEAAWSGSVKKTITGELRLPLTYGIAKNKLVAKVATTVGKSRGDLRVEDGGEAAFLAPHAVRLMPGVGEVMERELHAVGVRRIGDIARLSPQLFSHLFGASGRALHEHARGIDHSPIRPYRRQKSLGAESTYSEDVLDPEIMLATLRRLAARVGQDLRAKGFLTRTLTLTLRYADFVTATRTLHCEYTNADHVIDAVARRAFRALYTRRVRVRLLGITTADLIEDYGQLFLFDEENDATGGGRDTDADRSAGGGRYARLYRSLDDIRDRFGAQAVMYGSSLAERPRHERA